VSAQLALWLEDLPGGLDPALALSAMDVARLPSPVRRDRVGALVESSHQLVDTGRDLLVGDKTLAGTCVLFSGGNDSTVLAHLMRDQSTHAVHANTGIGVEASRQFVRDTCHAWGLPLIEKHPNPEDSYEAHVLAHGFPGPGHHFKMYQRLKERALRKARSELVADPRRERVIFLAGRRREESQRRAAVPEFEREGSIVWISPMVLWTALDLNTYRLMHDVPVNPVTQTLHMSGECLCGSFAQRGELDEITLWHPEAAAEIQRLAALIADDPSIPAERKRWGWGAYRDQADARSGRLCGSCAVRGQAEFEFEAAS
jgi:3'-phosphoadenosine 5'-phosphosulfate sulfotransferase (PAPS reductase)/FAD synthetase